MAALHRSCLHVGTNNVLVSACMTAESLSQCECECDDEESGCCCTTDIHARGSHSESQSLSSSLIDACEEAWIPLPAHGQCFYCSGTPCSSYQSLRAVHISCSAVIVLYFLRPVSVIQTFLLSGLQQGPCLAACWFSLTLTSTCAIGQPTRLLTAFEIVKEGAPPAAAVSVSEVPHDLSQQDDG